MAQQPDKKQTKQEKPPEPPRGRHGIVVKRSECR